MILSHKIALDPTYKQREYFARAAGTARFVWNLALARWKELYLAGKQPSAAMLKAEFNTTKYELYPWLGGIHRDAHAEPFMNLGKAFTAFFKGTAKYPRFKSKKRSRDSFYVANDKFRTDGKRIRLPVIGLVRMRESLRFVGKITGAVVSRECGRWSVAIQVDVGDYSRPRVANGAVGIDLGLTTFAMLSDGTTVVAPKPLRHSLRRLRIRQRSLSRRGVGSSNREKQRRVVAKTHARITNIRCDFVQKFTTRVCRENQAIGVESLNVAGMVRNRKLSRAISDVAWGETLRQFDYKAVIFGCALRVADRFEPSSKRCHVCGLVKKSLALSERTFTCDGCGSVCDRDLNAALNLVPLADGNLRLGRLPAAAVAEPGTTPRAQALVLTK